MTFSLYLFRRGMLLFLSVLFGLTTLVWVTQALRRLDLVTTKGQTILTFVWMTLLAVPMLVSYVTPFALIAATAVLFSQMHSDREVVVFQASGARPSRILMPLLSLSMAVGLALAALSMVTVPKGLRLLRDGTNAIRADFLTSIIQPGKFVSLEEGFTFHLNDRLADGSLAGLFLHDERDPALTVTYSAQHGAVLELTGRNLLIMERGAMERRNKSNATTSFINFDNYAFDLSELQPTSANGATIYDPTELSMAELIAQQSGEPDPHRASLLVTELHTRLTAIFYPIAVTLTMFCFLGAPRTAREKSNTTLTVAIIIACLVRVAAFGVTNIVSSNTSLWPLMWGWPILCLIAPFIALALTNRAPRGRALPKLKPLGVAQ